MPLLRPRVAATAPGKLILMGEHSVVYGQPALVVTLGLETRVELWETAEGEGVVDLELDDLSVSERTTWSDLWALGERARVAWERLAAGGGGEALERLRTADPAQLVKIALAETLREADVASESLPSIALRVSSELPLGAGFGSSASVAVATAGALSKALTGETRHHAIDRIAFEAERRQHGRPSGADHTTVLEGGAIWAERSPEGGGLSFSSIDLPPEALGDLSVFHTGAPRESTGEMVESVARRLEDPRERGEERLRAMGDAVRDFRERLETGRSGRVGAIRSFERHLEALGVVPEAVRRRVREIEALGAAAKISGAGGLRGPEAGALVVCDPRKILEGAACLEGLEPIRGALGGRGLRVRDLDG